MQDMVETSGDSDHFPIVLTIKTPEVKPPAPFKLKPQWLEEEEYRDLILGAWEPLQETQNHSLMQQFADNLARAKKISKEWDEKFRRRQQEELSQIELQIKELYENNEGVFSEGELGELKKLEGRKEALLLQEEKKWRLKSRALWLEEGDQNTKYFHRYASQRKSINTIHEIRTVQGSWAKSFEEKTQAAVEHFQGLFKETEGCPITEILEVLDMFPSDITEEMNE